MKVKIGLFFVMAITYFQVLAAESIEQSFSRTKGNIQQTAGENSDIKNDNMRNISSSDSRNNNKNSVVINIQANAKEIISRLPASQRKVASEVSNIAIDMVNASTTKDNSEIKDRITNKLAGFSLLDYRASDSPFKPPVRKLQFMCGNIFRFTYNGTMSGGGRTVTFIVNNESHQLVPGKSRTFESNGTQLELLYLEYSEKEKSPIIHYDCKPIE